MDWNQWIFCMSTVRCMVFNAVFNSISVISPCFPGVLLTSTPQIFFPSHWLLSHITTIEPTDSGERGMNLVAMTIINPRKEYWGSRDRTSNLLFSSPQCYRLSYGTRLHVSGPLYFQVQPIVRQTGLQGYIIMWCINSLGIMHHCDTLTLYHTIPSFNDLEK